MVAPLKFSEWARDVDVLCRHHLGCSWDDLCGDEQPLRRGFEARDTPLEFVRWWWERYDLDLIHAFPVEPS